MNNTGKNGLTYVLGNNKLLGVVDYCGEDFGMSAFLMSRRATACHYGVIFILDECNMKPFGDLMDEFC
jgi:hypothetical protein